VETNRYILINDIANHLPHLTFEKTASAQVLLFLVLVHIFMLGESCKEGNLTHLKILLSISLLIEQCFRTFVRISLKVLV
jgi:hypothetical protein